MTVAGAQTPPAAQPAAAPKADQPATTAQPSTTAQPTTAAQPTTNACYVWKGRGGAPTASYMASFAICRPWNSNYGWKFAKKSSGMDYYYGTFKDTHTTAGSYAIYADFSSAVVSTKAEYDSFVAGTKIEGACGECLH